MKKRSDRYSRTESRQTFCHLVLVVVATGCLIRKCDAVGKSGFSVLLFIQKCSVKDFTCHQNLKKIALQDSGLLSQKVGIGLALLMAQSSEIWIFWQKVGMACLSWER